MGGSSKEPTAEVSPPGRRKRDAQGENCVRGRGGVKGKRKRKKNKREIEAA